MYSKRQIKLSFCPVMKLSASIVLEAELLPNGNGQDKWIWISRSPVCDFSRCTYYNNCPILKEKAEIYMKK